MQCPNCEHKNPQAANFCNQCGTKLERKCSNCGADYRRSGFLHEMWDKAAWGGDAHTNSSRTTWSLDKLLVKMT